MEKLWTVASFSALVPARSRRRIEEEEQGDEAVLEHRPRRVLLDALPAGRSAYGIVQSELGVKEWMERLPSVAAARPGKCPRCGVASQEPGRCLAIHGQGKVVRQQWGPRVVDGAPEIAEIILRLYECQRCYAVIRVGPRGLIEHHRYAATAIAMALCLWLVDRLPQRIVRSRMSPWFHLSREADAERRWRSLRRWSSKIAAGRLWSDLSARTGDIVTATLRALAALVPEHGLGVSLHRLAFAGAAHHRRGPSTM